MWIWVTRVRLESLSITLFWYVKEQSTPLGANSDASSYQALVTWIIFLGLLVAFDWLEVSVRAKGEPTFMAPWYFLALSVTMTILWIIAIPFAFPTCSDLCPIIPPGYPTITYVDTCCSCVQVRSIPCTSNSLGSDSPFTQNTGLVYASRGLNIIIM